MPQIIVKLSNEEQIYNLPQDSITFGRVNTCDIELPVKSVSRKHAEIIQEHGEYYLVDLRSGNGTKLKGKKIKPKEKNLLRSGDEISIEDYTIIFLALDEDLNKPVEENTDTDIIEIKMIKKVLKALENETAPSIEVLNSASNGKKALMSDGIDELIIGREPECDLPIDDHTVSRQHAKLLRKWGGVVLSDLGSKNGTFVNHERITEKVVRDGDKLMFGTVKCLYRNSGDVNIDVISKEISRKKREAALKESEQLSIRQTEASLAEEKAKAESKAKEEAELAAKEAAVEEMNVANPETENQTTTGGGTPPLQTNIEAPQEGLSNAEKVFIGVGIVVGIIAVLLLAWLLS